MGLIRWGPFFIAYPQLGLFDIGILPDAPREKGGLDTQCEDWDFNATEHSDLHY